MIALRERNFRLYWLGQAVSNTGNWMHIVALSWFVLQLTGNPITIGSGIVLALFALTPLFPLATLILIACGAGATMTMTIANTLLQTQAPSGMRGRVMSLYTLIAAGLTPLGALVISSLGAGIGLSMATAIMGAGIVICVVVGYWYLT